MNFSDTNIRSFIPALFFLLIPILIQCQTPSFSTTNFTTNDGLPSNECHDILQDSLGFIWIASDRGLVSYDGYDFKTYDSSYGLSNISCLDLCLDNNQNIWINTYGSEVFYLDRQKDTIIPYQFQEIIFNHQWSNQIQSIEIDVESNLYFNLSAHGILIIDSLGSYDLVYKQNLTSNTFWSYDIDKNVMLSFQRHYRPEEDSEKFKNEFAILTSKRLYPKQSTSSGIFKYEEYAFRLNDSINVWSIGNASYFMRADTIWYTRPEKRINSLEFYENFIITSQLYNGGVKLYNSIEAFLRKDVENILLDNISCSSAIFDVEGNIWVSSITKGIYFLKQIELEPVSLGLKEEESLTSLEVFNENIWLVLNQKDVLHKTNYDSLEKVIYSSANSKINELVYISELDKLFLVAENSGFIREKKLDEIKYYHKNDSFPVQLIKYKSTSEIRHILIGTGYFFVVDDISTDKMYAFNPNEKIKYNDICYLSNDSIYSVNNEGLYQFKNNKFVPSSHTSLLIKDRINVMDYTSTHLMLGSNTNGLILIDSQGKIRQFTTEDGLLSNSIENIYVVSNRRIFVMTKKGLSILWNENSNQFNIHNLTVANGLASNTIVDVVPTKNGRFLIGTSKGISNWNGKLKHHITKAPIIENVFSNNIPSKLTKFAHNKNDIRIDYKSIVHKAEGQIDYRYKLNDGPWIQTELTSLTLSALSPGKYNLLVQAKIDISHWSEITRYNWIIRNPWWKTYWFYFGLVLLSLALIYSIIQYRINQFKRDNRLNEEIRNLEKSALQAQMNPHFIFNCLNSIQHFIYKNDSLSAMNYLASFAKLIRQNLMASLENRISLGQEIEMLQNYLKLEKLRFKNSFDYEIEVDQNIQINQIYIPSLLIQPFVENAVIHGMKTKNENGKIYIRVNKTKKNIHITIQDNGTGISTDQISQNRQSVGMQITKKRLAFIQPSIENQLLIESSENGTSVSFEIIPLEN